ncbi:MAG: hypothetical protein J6Q99_01005, partial [Oscillospiraceae bacterium]|nr:hypothetical protein [Oscillospiraceae bacterium]
MSTLLQLFGAAAQKLPQPLQTAAVTGLAVSEDKRKITVHIAPQDLVEHSQLHLASGLLRSVLQVDEVSFCPVYRIEQFAVTYFESLLSFLREEGVVVNGFFNSAELNFSDGLLTIGLRHGGAALLERQNFTAKLQQLVARQFGFTPQVQFEGVMELAERPAAAAAVQESDELPPLPTADDMPPWEASGDYSVLPDDYADEAVKPAAKPKAKPVKAFSFDSEGLPFAPGTEHVLMGRPIKGKLTPLSDVTSESGVVSVWGEIFEIETKVFRGGRILFLICFTDYTGSHMMKAMVPEGE